MSVINRMLTDLERRGGAPAAGAPDVRAAPPRRPPRRPVKTLLRGLLAVALIAVAAVLWIERGPRVIALAEDLYQPAATAAGDAADSGTATGADSGGQVAGSAGGGAAADDSRLNAAADPLPARLADIGFNIEAEHAAAIVLRFDGEPPPLAMPVLDAGQLELRLPAAAAGVAVPAPPPGQRVFRDLALVTGDDGARLRARVGDGVRIGLQAGDNTTLRLTGRRPASAAEPPPIVRIAPPPASAPDGAAAAGAQTTQTPAATATTATAQAATGPAGATAADTVETTAGDATGAEATTTAEVDTDEAGRQAETSTPQVRARRRFAEAREHLAAGELRPARRDLAAAVALEPGLHAAREVLVALLRRAGDDDAARDVLATGVELAPARIEYALPYARLLVDTGELERAAGVLEAARINAGASVTFHALAANIARRLGRHERAIADYAAALERERGNAPLWLGLGISLAAEGRRERAREAFAEARALGTLSERLDSWAEQRIAELGDEPEGR